MTTIMSWGNSSGTKGRCDARCHNAKGEKCKCMCGGRFHGKSRQPGGVEQAIREAWDSAIPEIERTAASQGMYLKAEAKTELPLVQE
ncbi:MAG: hypothetical protein PHU23_04980 [Dehalococcoidales bacterium]|nr:hypothetical protein [Dehalococcoidales bacterium]